MTQPPPPRPIPYDPAFEIEIENEKEVAAELADQMRKIADITSHDYGHAVRTVHAKSHGLLTGELRVEHGLAEEFAQGIFAKERTYPVVLRFSTNPGDILDDSVSAPRGLAVKVIGVEGERLPGSQDAATQDFVMANAPAFTAPGPAEFLSSLKLLASTTDTPQVWKKALSAVFRGAEKAVEATGGESGLLKSLGGQPSTHILGETFSTQAPLLHGRFMAKLFVVPQSPNLIALADTSLQLAGNPNALREATTRFFRDHDGEWAVKAQLLTDPETMPIEDASVVWPQDKSPLVTVARLHVPRQDAWSDAKQTAIDEEMSFSPWHGIAAHRPIGALMRARRPSYEMSASFRSSFNGCPIHEPTSRSDLPE